ncbi:MAG: NADH-quinone oxidoreductase subunit F, partial [Phycisphaerae bacterium]|nr:NADH-quinone oxidoreductase subunit F [candidate division KSB1 bacterium]NIT70223.1 NADH-quinone oxidoreductase subunit F [candidate division KSB1 bacterium]NIV00279.1 NADH-quinone oxidoreductase subunit F [Phycisphaerae bacterium]NIW68310.1 NADH-quinone oxidoreductase subunit F [candidate division KSB1 bacterium]NIX69904.1 NADH-quinone oxidoreductase subunit F [candidate division KSB1 bacterium]
GAGAYICGEETGLIESLEGKRGWPRIKPPFPAVEGVFGCPTIVNNVETLACVPYIINRGADWFKSIGPENGPGPKLFCLSGHVKKPGVYELPMGVSLRELIYEHGGGIRNDKKLKAVIPGGSSVPVLTADEIDVGMDFNSLAEVGSMLGSAGVIVIDEDTCMVDSLLNITHFYRHESCGQCTPCREGTNWAERVLKKIKSGAGSTADIDLLDEMAAHIGFRTICPLGDAAAMPIQSFVKKFRHEFEAYVPKKVA